MACTALPICSGNLRELLGVLLDVLRPVVADRAQRLAGEAAADDGVVLVRLQQRVLVAGDGARFGRRDEPGAEPHAVGAERERGREPASVEQSAGRDDGNAIADRVDDLRHERHRRNRAGVAAGFGALRDHEVAAGFDRGDRVAHLAAHARDEHVAVVQHLEHVARHAEARRRTASRRRSTTFDASSSMRSGNAARRSTPNGLVGELAHMDDLVFHLLGRHRGRAERADAARVGHRGDQRVVGNAAHSGEHDGVLDAEHLSESCVHFGIVH